MKIKTLSYLVVSFLVIISNAIGAVNATLISDLSARDWKVMGDNALTYDASTGLEWLDLSETYGNSILDTEAEYFYGEFRWANSNEIVNLLNSVLGKADNVGNYSSEARTNAIMFTGLLGLDDAGYSQGISRGSSAGLNIYNIETFGLGFVQLYDDPNKGIRVRVNHPNSNCCFAEYNKLYRLGSWLVRTAKVPEPPTFLVFGLGLVGLASHRFKK